MRRFRKGITLAAVTLLLMSGGTPAHAQGPLESVAVGVFLSNLMDQLEQAIDQARNAGLSLEIQAGREVSIAIANAQNAYSDILTKTIDSVDPKVKSALDQLQSMVNDVKSDAPVTIADIATRAQQVVNSLPFRPHEPQLTKFTPAFIVPAQQSYPVIVSLDGNFEYAARQGFSPTLVIDSKPYSVSQNSTQNLKFSLPVGDLFPVTANVDPAKYRHTTLLLKVPWESSGILGLNKKKQLDQYRIIVGALPASPGTIVLQHTVPHTDTETRRFKSGGYHQSSQREAGNDDHKDVPYSVTPDTGWHVVRNTSKFEGSTCHGDWSQSFGGDDGDHVVYFVTTIHKSAGSSGICDFSISFDETRDVAGTAQAPDEKISLNWGDTKSFSYPAGTWKLVYDAFDGHHSEFTGSDESDRFLKVRNEQGSWIISTADPKTLTWP